MTPAERDRLFALGLARLDQAWAAADDWFADAPPGAVLDIATLLRQTPPQRFLREAATSHHAASMLCRLADLAIVELASRYLRHEREATP